MGRKSTYQIALDDGDGDTAPDDVCGHIACCNKAFPGGYWPEFKRTWGIAWALMLTQFSQLLLQPIAVMFSGHLGKIELDALALSNSIINVFGNSLVLGMSTACDTYFSQAYGNNQMKLIGIVLQRGIVIHVLLLLICYALYLNAEGILIGLGQDKEVARLSQDYLEVFLPGLFFLFMYTLLRRYLASQNIVYPHLIIGCLGVGVAIVFQYLFLYVFNWGIIGSSIAQDIACFFMFAATIIYILVSKVYKYTWDGWSWRLFDDWGAFVKLGVFGIFMFVLEWAAFEITLILSGVLGTTQQAAQAVLLNLDVIFFSLGIGMSDATAIRVGQALGAGRPLEASTSARVGLTLTGTISVIACILQASLRFHIPKLFSSDQEVIDLAASLLPFPAVYVIFDGVSYIGRGLCRGCGRQEVASVAYVVVYYVIAMPIGIPLMFLTPLDVMGSWVGLVIALFLCAVFFGIYVYFFLDWNKESERAIERVTSGTDNEVIVTDNGVSEDVLSDSHRKDTEADEKTAILTDSQNNRSYDGSIHDHEPFPQVISGSKMMSPQRLILKRLPAIMVCVVVLVIGVLCRVLIDLPQGHSVPVNQTVTMATNLYTGTTFDV